MKSSIGKNVFANFLGKVWTVLVSILFVPLFLKFMGEEAYGVVTFFAVMQSVLNILGVGLQRTLRREFAKTGNNLDEVNLKKYKVLRSFEFIYVIVFIVISALCFFGSSFIAKKWLVYKTLDPSTVANSIFLMGVSIGLQLIANLYAGGIYGLDYQGLANGLQIGWMTLKNAGVIPIIILTNGSVSSFYIWMVFTDVLYCFVLRIILLKKIPTKTRRTWRVNDLSVLKDIWKYAGGLFLISVGTALSTQLDKIIMSKNLSLVDCGAYNTVFQLGSFTSYVPTIIGTAIFSILATLFFENKKSEAETLFKSMNRISVIVVSSMAAYIALFSYELILVWTGSGIYADIMRIGAPLVIFGFMLNAFQQVPYDYLLASGNTKLNQWLLAISIPYVLVVTVYLTKIYGVLGASFSWFLQLFILTTLYLLIFYKISFGKGGFAWLMKDVYGVIALALIPAVSLRLICNQLSFKPLYTVLLAVFFGAATLGMLLFVFERKEIKPMIDSRLKNRRVF